MNASFRKRTLAVIAGSTVIGVGAGIGVASTTGHTPRRDAVAQRSRPATRSGRAPGANAAAAKAAQTEGRAVSPDQFAAGACVSFESTDGNRGETVFLDAGHGGVDPGAVGTTQSGETIHEADQTLQVELDSMNLLRAQGFTVVVWRTGTTSVARLSADDLANGVLTAQGARADIAARDQCANIARANILIGSYFDAGGSSQNAGSVTAYDSARPFAADNLKLAELVQADVLAQVNARGWAIPDDGVSTDNTLGGPALTQADASYGHLMLLGPPVPGYLTTPSEMPGALIEPLYVTDPAERHRFSPRSTAAAKSLTRVAAGTPKGGPSPRSSPGRPAW